MAGREVPSELFQPVASLDIERTVNVRVVGGRRDVLVSYEAKRHVIVITLAVT